MFKIYITAKALADVYLDEKDKDYKAQSDWFHILLKQEKIYTIDYIKPRKRVVDEDDISDSAVVTAMSLAYDMDFVPKDSYISSVIDDNSKVYEQPNAAFFLDIEPEVAEDIQKHYGVICQSTKSDIDTSVFIDECITVNFVKTRVPNGGWKELFEVQKSVPSNAMCIIDRNLFTYDGQNNRDYPNEIIYNGLNTISLILYNALPDVFKETYQLTVVCDIKNIQNCLIFQTLQQELFTRIDAISKIKKYPIFAQLIAVDDKIAYYSHSFTHNRQIVSNYQKMGFDNGINAIRFYTGQERKAEYTQEVQGKLMYVTGLKNIKSDCPADSIITTQKEGRWLFNKWMAAWDTGEYIDHYYYADNNGDSSIRHFKNRLFT